MKLFFRKYGSGPPLIILHGLYGSSDNWITIARKAGERFTVYLPDARNHGHSPHNSLHDYESMASDLHELVSDLDLKEFFLAGHSMGGKTAVCFTLKWPGMIKGLLVADISPFTPLTGYEDFYQQHLSILRAIMSVDAQSVSSREEADSLLAQSIGSEKIRSMLLKNLERTGTHGFRWRLNAGALYNNITTIIDGCSRDRIDPVTGFPVLFLKGTLSGYLPESDFRYIEQLYPASEIISIKGAGHWIHSERPDDVIKYLYSLAE